MVDYIVVQDAKYSADTEGAVMYLMNLHWGKEQKVDKRLKRYGIADKDCGGGGQNVWGNLMARYDAICQHTPRKIKQADIQKENPTQR